VRNGILLRCAASPLLKSRLRLATWQAKAIVELLVTFNWTYASIVHSDSDYGMTGYQSLAKHVSEQHSICLADPITIYNEHFSKEEYEGVIKKLLENTMSRVVIVFADRVPAGKVTFSLLMYQPNLMQRIMDMMHYIMDMMHYIMDMMHCIM
jgi:hypothetical protein